MKRTSADVRWLLYIFINYVFACLHAAAELYDLTGKPEFRDVTLQWKSDESAPLGFRIDYCELQPWGRKMCRRKVMNAENGNSNKQWSQSPNHYVYKVEDLRMATNYSFQVSPHGSQNLQAASSVPSARSSQFKFLPRGGKGHVQEIYLATKQFSAVASRCLAEASEIDIETGPHFGGLITVEHPNSWSNSFKDGDCSVRGNPSDTKSVYTLNIDHSKCGSQTSKSTVTTFVIVQENLPILTHSTKRFMVVCNYSMPDSFTVKAAVQMPPHLRPSGRGQGEVIPVADSELPRAQSLLEPASEIRSLDLVPEDANLIDSRLSVFKDNSKWVSPLHQSHEDAVGDNGSGSKYAQLVLMLILIIASVIGCSAAVWWFVKGARIQQGNAYSHYASSDTSSIASIERSFRQPDSFVGRDSDDFSSIGTGNPSSAQCKRVSQDEDVASTSSGNSSVHSGRPDSEA